MLVEAHMFAGKEAMSPRSLTTLPWPWLIYISSFCVVYVLPMALEYQTRASESVKSAIEKGVLAKIESSQGIIRHIDNNLFFYFNLLENPIFKFFISALILQWFFHCISQLND